MTTPTESLRRAMLTVVIAELCGGDVSDVAQPTCPHCNEGPAMVLPAWQAFCGNDDCDVFIWNPTEPAAEFERKAKHLTAHQEDGRTVWRPEP